MPTLKKFALVSAIALCAISMTASFAQETPAPAPPPPPPPGAAAPADDKPAQKVPTMQEARQLLQAEEFEAAAKAFHAIVTADPDNANAWHFLGFSLHSAGNLTDALPCHLMAAEFAQTAPIASYNVACVYSLRNKADKAFKWLEKARELGFNNRSQIDGDSDLDNIRKDPRFEEYLKSLEKVAPGAGLEDAVVDPSGEKKEP